MRLASRPALVRLAVIDREIRGGRLPNANSLARQLEVNPRTVHRDLDCLRDQLGAPLEFDRDRNGYYYTNASWLIPYPQLSEGELLALFLASRLLKQYQGTPFAADLARMFGKIT